MSLEWLGRASSYLKGIGKKKMNYEIKPKINNNNPMATTTTIKTTIYNLLQKDVRYDQFGNREFGSPYRGKYCIPSHWKRGERGGGGERENEKGRKKGKGEREEKEKIKDERERKKNNEQN